ncbi:hypothetical protein RJ035_004480 [Blastomyces gilchristii]
MRMTIIARTKNFSVEVEHTVQRSTVASLRGAPVKSSSFEIMPTASAPVLQLLKRGDSYFVSAGTGKLLPASLPDLMSSWAGVAMAFEAGYIRDELLFPEDQGPESFSYDLMASMDDRSRHEKLKARAWKDRMAWERWGVRPQDVVRYRVSYFKSILLADGTIEMDDNEKADIPGSRQRYCIFVGFEMKPREGLMVLRFLVSSEDGLKPWTKLAPHNYTLRDLGIRLDESSGSTSPTTEFEDD